MENPGLETQFVYPGNPQPQHIYVGFWRRFVAYMVDVLVFTVVIVLLILIGLESLLGGGAFSDPSGEPSSAALAGFAVVYLSLIAGVWLYFALMESSSFQGTLGKMAIGVKVVDYNGQRISFGRATGRYFSRILSSIFLIGYIMAGFSSKKQALHDLIAKTYVVKK